MTCCPARPRRVVEPDLQRDHGGWRVLDQRLRVRDGHPGASRCHDLRAMTIRILEPPIAVAGHLAREIVRGGEGATKLVTVQVTGAAPSTMPGLPCGRSRIAAREDGHSWRRPELGPPRWRPRAGRAPPSTSTAPPWTIGDIPLFFAGGCRTTIAPRRPLAVLPARGRHSGRPRRRRSTRRHDVDL